MSTDPSSDRSDLAKTLLEHAVDITRADGPDALSLREVQRRAGVSSAAAYRHYTNRQALLFAVGQHASRVLADHIARAHDAAAPDLDGAQAATARLRAGCHAYIDFARTEPGLFAALLLTGEEPIALVEPDAPSRGETGVGPFELLRNVLEDVADHAMIDPDALPWSDVAVWAACHGLGVLLVDGPLNQLDDAERTAATTRLIDIVVHGLAAPAATADEAGPPGSLPGLRLPAPRLPT